MAQYIYGRNVVVARLKEAKDIDEIYLLDSFKDKNILDLVKNCKVKTIWCKKGKLDSLAGNEFHQGIVAKVHTYDYYGFDALLETGLSNLNAELQNYAGMNYTQLKDAIEKNYGVRPTSMNQVRTILSNNAMNNIAYDGMSSAAYNNAKTRATNMVNSLKGYSTKKKK